LKAASIAWRLSLAALLLTTTWQVWQLRRAPAWIAAQIEQQGNKTRAAALKAIGDTRHDLDARVDRLIDVSQQSIQDIALRADTRLEDLTVRIDRQLTTANATLGSAANTSLGEVSKLRADVEPLLPPIRNTLEVVSENADLLGRCAVQDPQTGGWIGNPDCFANRVIPALKSVEHMANAGEHMAQAVEKETPATAAAVRSTSQSAARIADHFAHPVSWIKGVLMTGARMAGKWFGF
jgi:methyl-accepting chemotaxis protein